MGVLRQRAADRVVQKTAGAYAFWGGAVIHMPVYGVRKYLRAASAREVDGPVSMAMR